MVYDRFDELITRQYGVVVKGWPLPKFCNPSAVTSRIELELLYNAWQTGVSCFQKLTTEELDIWENSQFSSRIASMTLPAEPVATLTLSPTPEPSLRFQVAISPGPVHQGAPVTTTNPIQNTPLTSIGNLAGGLALSQTDARPPAPDSNTIAMMIHADPTLQNVDPALIALGIMQGHQSLPPATTAPAVREPSNQTPYGSGSKRSRQEFDVVTPLSYDARTAKKPRHQRNHKRLQQTPVVQGVENVPTTGGRI